MPESRCAGACSWPRYAGPRGAASAAVTQAILFSLIHLEGAVPEEQGDVLLAAAASVVPNVPMGLALGVVTVGTGSLALPTALHVAGHLTQDALS